MSESTYTRILVLTVLSLLFFPFRGTATKIVPNTKRVGVMYLTRNVGDMIFCTPIFRALKLAKPESEMYVIGQKRNAETLRYNPDVHVYLEYPSSLFVLWKMVRALNLEYAFLINPSALELTIFYLAGVPAIASFKVPVASAETRAYRILKHLCIQVPFTAGENFASENLKLIAPLGIIATDTRKHLFFSDTAKETIDAFFKAQSVTPGKDFVIALAPGAGTKVKQWPAERFAKLADYLYQKHHVPIFIVGGPGDTAELQSMSEALLPETRIVSCLHHSIDELKAFMARVDIMIANDSAPIYVAEAFDKATVTIVGPTDENEHPPKGQYHRVVKSKDRGVPALAAKMTVEQRVRVEDARSQIEKVTLSDVIATVDELIAALKQ